MSSFKYKYTQQRLPLGDLAYSLSTALNKSASRLSRLIREGNYSRAQLCDLVGGLLNRKISAAQFNAWLAAENRNRMPADVLIAICHILNNFEALDLLLEPAGQKCAGQAEQAYEQIGRAAIGREELDRAEMAARSLIKGYES